MMADVAEVRDRIRVLYLDDDPDFLGEIAFLLRRYGFLVEGTSSYEQFLSSLIQFQPNIVVVDQFLRDIDMLAHIPQLRKSFSGPIIILSGNEDRSDRILGLEGGADDYIVKTTDPREIVARLRAQARRVQQLGLRSPGTTKPTSVPTQAGDLNGWKVDYGRREIRTPRGAVVNLTGLEFDLFHELHSNPGVTVSREQLSQAVLRRSEEVSGRSIENLVSRIRSKFTHYTGDRIIIKAIRGQGYVFVGFDR
jgi:two-component system OmpR family response regulator